MSPGLATNRSPPVVTDDPPKSLRLTTEVASAAFAVDTSCRRLPHAMRTCIRSLITTTTLSLGQSRVTEENGHAVQKEL